MEFYPDGNPDQIISFISVINEAHSVQSIGFHRISGENLLLVAQALRYSSTIHTISLLYEQNCSENTMNSVVEKLKYNPLITSFRIIGSESEAINKMLTDNIAYIKKIYSEFKSGEVDLSLHDLYILKNCDKSILELEASEQEEFVVLVGDAIHSLKDINKSLFGQEAPGNHPPVDEVTSELSFEEIVYQKFLANEPLKGFQLSALKAYAQDNVYELNEEKRDILFKVIQSAKDALKGGIAFRTGDAYEAALAAKNVLEVDLPIDEVTTGLFIDGAQESVEASVEVAGEVLGSLDTSA